MELPGETGLRGLRDRGVPAGDPKAPRIPAQRSKRPGLQKTWPRPRIASLDVLKTR